MDLVKVGSIVVAVATLLTEVALIGGFVWSIASRQPVILPVTLGVLSAGFGVFVYYDYKKFFGTKAQ